MKKIPIKEFWMKPDPVPLKAREFTFGYTERDGKKKKYKVEVLRDDLYSFQLFVFKLLDAERGSFLPWPYLGDLKKKVKVINLDDGVEQMELKLKANKIARRSLQARYIREEGKGKPGEKGYRPTLWYWITPSGKKLKVDQKETEE